MLAMEARDRCSLYIREVRDDGGDIGNALTFLKQVGNALSPSRGDLYDLNSSIHCLKWVLDKAAASRPTPERDSALSWSAFLAGHPEVETTPKPTPTQTALRRQLAAERRALESVHLSPERFVEALRVASAESREAPSPFRPWRVSSLTGRR
ncbi:MAG TPA: hypothetical protein VEY87_08050 [Gaiellaceae bacterium]|nr:hypothetical protein [Gaiellaceae bacterium]